MMFWLSLALAATPEEDAQQVELDRARGVIADQIQLVAYDLVDEMVYGWSQEPVFDKPTPVVLASVSVPVGLGSGLAAMVENHLNAVILENTATHVKLVHCPTCTSVVVHSGPEATVVSRGVDNPAALAELGGATGRHALFVDIEAEGAYLVLRARLTALTPELPVVWSHTIATSSSTPAMLRQGDRLKSASDARQEYLDALRGRGPIWVPVRLGVRTFASGDSGISVPPMIWLQSGIEVGVNDARAWTSSIVVGYSFIPQAYQGILAQARVSRLVTGRSRSLTRPDLYLYAGAAVMTVWGPATIPLRDDTTTADDIIAGLLLQGPRTSLGTLQVGVDLRIGRRVGLSAFLENIPSLRTASNVGEYISVAGIEANSIGTEVSFCF